MQERECEKISVEYYYSDTRCDYLEPIITDRVCQKEGEEIQEEIGELNDTVGEPIEEEPTEENSSESEGNLITGAFAGIAGRISSNPFYLIIILIIIVLGFSYYRYYGKKMPNLSEEEKKKLNEMSEYSEYLKKK